jgi:macrolide-specific efflux system membrane fusion protein
VTVGQQTQTEAEITSGLSAGQSIIYTRTFSGFPGGRNGNPGQGGGFPGGQSGGFPGGQGGAAPSGQPGQTTGGA